MFNKRAFVTVLLAGGMLMLITSVAGSFQRNNRFGIRQLEGSWKVNVSPEFPIPYEALVTYTADETLIETKYYLSEFVSMGHGEWTFAGLGKFNVTFIRLIRDSTGTVYGLEKVRERITITEPGSYTSVREVDTENFGFPEQRRAYTETTTATRIRVEPLE